MGIKSASIVVCLAGYQEEALLVLRELRRLFALLYPFLERRCGNPHSPSQVNDGKALSIDEIIDHCAAQAKLCCHLRDGEQQWLGRQFISLLHDGYPFLHRVVLAWNVCT